MPLPLNGCRLMLSAMAKEKNDGESKLTDRDADELLKDAAEGLRQLSGASQPSEAVTLPGIPLDALRLDSRAPTQKMKALALDDVSPTDREPPASAGAPGDKEAADEETIPPEAGQVAPTTQSIELPDVPDESEPD